mgnify:CR=1 FL=1
MAVFEVTYSNERILPNSGMALVGTILERGGFREEMNRLDVTGKRSGHQIKDGDVMSTYIALCCMGKPAFEAVHEMDDDPAFYALALGMERIPSEVALRQRMDQLGHNRREAILTANAQMLTGNGVTPNALPNGYVPVDMDVTPFDNSKTKKEGVSRTYKGFDGYAPMMAYIGTQGYMINTELRPGKQHCQNHTPEFLRQTIALSKSVTDAPLMFRMDCGNDAAENMQILLEEGCWFLIKRNLRKESKDEWLLQMKQCCQDVTHPREGKDVYIGSTWKDVVCPGNTDKQTMTLRAVYEITQRTIDKHGQYLLIPDVEVNMFWSNLPLTDRELIALYHAHGESEQYHSELKSDMDMERLPSGKFETNALALNLSMIAYNVLRMIGQESLRREDAPLKRKVSRRRLRTVIENLVMMASHVTTHARKIVIGLGCSNPWRRTFARLFYTFSLPGTFA